MKWIPQTNRHRTSRKRCKRLNLAFSLQSMVKDMDSYQDRCIGKDDFFKLATVKYFSEYFNGFVKIFLWCVQDVQLLDFTARKMKMPVGEKKKRKDKDGEKVSKQNPKNFDHSGIQNQIDETREIQAKIQYFVSDLPRPLALLLCCVQYSKENRRARGGFFLFQSEHDASFATISKCYLLYRGD